MSTGTTLITRSMRMIGAVASGEAPTAAELADGLIALNGLLESWRNQKLLVYAMVESTLSMVASDASYTVGTSGNLNITRPVKFEDAFMRVSNIDSPVRLIEQDEWDAIPDKATTSSLVELAFYNPTMDTSQGTLQVYPVPTTTNVLHLVHWVVLASLSVIGDTVLLPPGYDRMVASNLAIEISPEFPGCVVTDDLRRIARDSLKAIKTINNRPYKLTSELARIMPGSRPRSRIETGP